MARLGAAEPGAWVVKGGMVLEWRLGERARATRDLDLVRRGQAIGGSELRERLVDLFATDKEDDRFVCRVRFPRSIGSRRLRSRSLRRTSTSRRSFTP